MYIGYRGGGGGLAGGGVMVWFKGLRLYLCDDLLYAGSSKSTCQYKLVKSYTF